MPLKLNKMVYFPTETEVSERELIKTLHVIQTILGTQHLHKSWDTCTGYLVTKDDHDLQ